MNATSPSASPQSRTPRLRERTHGDDALGTPVHILDTVRRFAGRRCRHDHNGRINLDPASSPEHNALVGAERIYTVEDDGLAQVWDARFLWLNPPFGVQAGRSVKAMWFVKAVEEYRAGHLTEAVVLLPTALDAKWFGDVTPWPRVDLRDRVRFRGAVGAGAQTPICLVYLGSDVDGFFEFFGQLGTPVPGVTPDRDDGPDLIGELFESAAAEPKKPDTLHAFLNQHPGAILEPAEVTPDDLRAWLAEGDEHNRAGARSAYLVGRALLVQRQTTKHGNVANWAGEQASLLGRSARTIRLYVQVARAVDAESATPLPISVLDRPLRDVPSAIRAVREGRDPDARPEPKPKPPSKPKVGKVEQWRQSAHDLVSSLPRGASRKELLRAHLVEVYHALLAVDPELVEHVPPQPQDADQTPFAVAAAAAVATDKPLPPSVLKARKLVVPPMTYAGGKTRVKKPLVEATGVLVGCGMYGDRVFREPFAGGGAVSLNMRATGRAGMVWLNDAERGVAAFHTAVVREPGELIDRVESVQITSELVWDCSAALDAGDLKGIDLAMAELIVRQCFFGGFGRMSGSLRTNLTSRWNTRLIVTRIKTAHRLLKGRVLYNECTNLDAREVIAAPGQCFIYADPPYVQAGPDLYPQPLDAAMHRELAGALLATDQPWLLSYDDHPLVHELYRGSVFNEILVPRQNKPAVPELLICPAGHADILRPDDEPDLIQEIFGRGVP